MKKFFVKALAMLLVCIFVISGINFSIFASDDSESAQSVKPLGDKLVAANVAITGRVKLWFYFTNTQNVHRYVVEIPGEDSRTVYVSNMAESVKNGDTRRVLEVSLAAAQQSVKVKVTPYAKDGTRGTTREYSVMDYANQVINLAATNDNYKYAAEALKSMLNYGAMAQKAFDGYNKDNLANAGLYFGSTNPVNNMSIDDIYGVDKMVKVTANSSALDLEKGDACLDDTVSLKLYLKHSCAKEDLKVEIEGKEYENEVLTDDDGDYILINNISATKFNYQYTVKITDGDGNTLTIKCSVLNYVKSLIAMKGTAEAETYGVTEDKVNAAYSMFQYYVKMWKYVNKSEPVGKPETCDHKRSYVDTKLEYAEICSDCGKDITPVDIVDNAANLANGVTAYFGTIAKVENEEAKKVVDGNRNNYVVENGNMSLYYPLATTNTAPKNEDGTLVGNPEKQFLATITDKDGNPYIQNTMDVYVKTSNGTYLASSSNKSATANIYRYGYYYYDVHMYGQNFMLEGANTAVGASKEVAVAKFDTCSDTTITTGSDGECICTITGTSDPYIYTSSHSGIYVTNANGYNAIQITMKTTSTTNVQLRYTTAIYGTNKNFNDTNMVEFNTIADGEYHTYTVFFDDSGAKYKLRLDFNGAKGEEISIKKVQYVKIDMGNAPDLLLDRGLHTYTDKMHQVLSIVAPKSDVEGITEVGMTTNVTASDVVIVTTENVWYGKDSAGNADGTAYEHRKALSDSVSKVAYAGFLTDAGVFGYILPYGDDSSTITVSYDGTKYTITQTIVPTDKTILGQDTLYKDSEKEPIIKTDANGDPVLDANGDQIILGYKSVLQTFIDKADNITKYGEDVLDSIGTSLNIYNSPTAFYFGQRIYTDETHDFSTFLKQAEIERNPLTAENIKINTDKTPDATFDGYDAIRGMYAFTIPENIGFNPGYYYAQNFHGTVSFSIKGDSHDRNMYVMAYSYGTSIEGGAVLDKDDTLLPIPTEVSKNFAVEFEEPVWLWGDVGYCEVRIPVKVNAGETQELTVLQTYMNWGQYPLKQISSIQFFAPYYHLSTGVTESNCIANYYVTGKDLQTLPDHRAASAFLWSDLKIDRDGNGQIDGTDQNGDGFNEGDPQHDNAGYHKFLQYTDSSGNKVASEPVSSVINSAGLTYADIDMTYISDDNNIQVTYKHLEMPQTDENRAYYEIKYKVLNSVTIENFANNFSFYSAYGYGEGYQSFSYWDGEKSVAKLLTLDYDKDGVCDNDGTYTLGELSETSENSYFTLYDIDNIDPDTGYTRSQSANVSFLIDSYKLPSSLSGSKFIVNVANRTASLSLNAGNVTLNEGDEIVIYAIIMPWGDEYSENDSLVQEVLKNTLLDPIVATPLGDTTAVENVFLPTVKSGNGLDATFTIGHNNSAVTIGESKKGINVAFRVDGFKVLATPKLYEQVSADDDWTFREPGDKEGEYKYWKLVEISSINSPDVTGSAHNYDGYAVYYTKEIVENEKEVITYSYSFVTNINGDADSKTFKVVVGDTYVEWEENHGDVYYDSADIYKFASSTQVTHIDTTKTVWTDASDSDCSYVRIYNNGKYNTIIDDKGTVTTEDDETIYVNDSSIPFKVIGGSAAKYMVLKYRIPNGNTASNLQFFMTTSGVYDGTADNFVLENSIIKQNDKWQIMVVDLASIVAEKKLTDMVASSVGTYNISSFRLDPFTSISTDYIDLAYIAFCRDILDVVEMNSDMDVSDMSYVTGTRTSGFLSDKIAAVEKFSSMNVVFTGSELYSQMFGGDWDGLTSDVVNLTNGIVTTTGKGNFGISVGGTVATGKYMVIKYRTSSVLTSGMFNVYASVGTNGIKDDKQNLSYSYGFIGDGKWHTLVLDLSTGAYNSDMYTVIPADDGKYYINWVRLDALRMCFTDTPEVEFEYIGFCDELSDVVLDDAYVDIGWQKWAASIEGVSIDGEVKVNATPVANGGLGNGYSTSCTNGIQNHGFGTSLDGTEFVANGWLAIDGCSISDFSYCVTDAEGVEHWSTVLKDSSGANRWTYNQGITDHATKSTSGNGLGYDENTIGYRWYLDIDLSEFDGQTVTLSMRAITDADTAVTIYSVVVNVPEKKKLDLVYKGQDLVDIFEAKSNHNYGFESAKLNDDGTVTVVTTGGDSPFAFTLDGTIATGQYLVIKYRSGLDANVNTGTVYCLGTTVTDTAWQGHPKLATAVADHKWHTLVIDLSAIDSMNKSEDGKYYATLVRADFCDAFVAGSSVDFAYIGLCDDLDDIALADKEYLELGWQNWTASMDTITIDGTPVDPANKDGASNKHLAVSSGASDRFNSYEGGKWAWSGWFSIDGQVPTDVSVCVIDEAGKEHWTSGTFSENTFLTDYTKPDGTHVGNYAENILGYAEGTLCYSVNVSADLSAFYSQTVNVSVRAITEDGYAVTLYSVFVDVPYTASPNYFDGSEIKNALMAGFSGTTNSDGSVTITDITEDTYNAEGKLVRPDGTVNFTSRVTGTPKYAVIRYKNTSESKLYLYAHTTDKDSTNPVTEVSLKTDGVWHVVVVDLEKAGHYTAGGPINLMRFDVCESAKDKSIIFDYVWFTDVIDEVEYEVYDKLDYSSTGSNLRDQIKATNYTNNYGEINLNDDGTVTLKKSSALNTEAYFTIKPDSSVVTGRYLVVKYRTTAANLKNTQIFSSTTQSGATGKNGDSDTGFVMHNDGQWHVMVVDLALITDVKAVDGVYDVNYIRFDAGYYLAANESIDFAYIGFCDDLSDIDASDTIFGAPEVSAKYSLNSSTDLSTAGLSGGNYTIDISRTVSASEIKFVGWLALDGYSYTNAAYKIVEDGKATDWTVMENSATFEQGVHDAGVELYGDDTYAKRIRIGSSTVPSIDLSGYAGETVTVYIAVANVVDGEINSIALFYELTVTVPAAQ